MVLVFKIRQPNFTRIRIYRGKKHLLWIIEGGYHWILVRLTDNEGVSSRFPRTLDGIITKFWSLLWSLVMTFYAVLSPLCIARILPWGQEDKGPQQDGCSDFCSVFSLTGHKRRFLHPADCRACKLIHLVGRRAVDERRESISIIPNLGKWLHGLIECCKNSSIKYSTGDFRQSLTNHNFCFHTHRRIRRLISQGYISLSVRLLVNQL